MRKKITFFAVFSRLIKAYPLAIALVPWGQVFPKTLIGVLYMRANRVLVAKGWYWVSTDINNREGVFRLPRAVRLLREMLREARGVYEFEIRGLRVEDNRVSFYINAVDGFMVILLNRGQLPQKPLQFGKNPLFSLVFCAGLKQNTYPIALSTVGKTISPKTLRGGLRMRANRVLVAKGWYWVSTDVNNREGVFRLPRAVRLLREVLSEARGVYEFEVRGLRVDADRVSFYINAVDGFQLPDIMQWIKQTFAVRYNVGHGRIGHVWGERYWSVVLGREPPEWAEVCDLIAADWVEGAEAAECGEGSEMAASERVQHKGSHHAAKRAKNPRVPPGSPGCASPPTA
jgi:REP element-mobilizing transposase RayT